MGNSSYRTLVASLGPALRSFQSARTTFKLVKTIPSSHRQSTSDHEAPGTLLILDSSFNPPSKAHGLIVLSALSQDALKKYNPPFRVVLLLSTNNADKAASPAGFDQRLALMTLFAEDIYQSRPDLSIDIDIGLTTAPYYTDKSAAIDGCAKEAFGSSPRHVHLLGYDTLTRFFAPKYYKDYDPPLSALKPYFDAGHELRVTLRPDDGYGSVDEQKRFISSIEQGDLEDQGADRGWASKMVTAEAGDGIGVSSTRVRRAAKESDWVEVEKLCTPSVAKAVREEAIYV